MCACMICMHDFTDFRRDFWAIFGAGALKSVLFCSGYLYVLYVKSKLEEILAVVDWFLFSDGQTDSIKRQHRKLKTLTSDITIQDL